MDKTAKIYCIIATYNAEKWIEKCLNSIVASTLSCHIVVIDNKSTDRTTELIKSDFPLVKLIENEENVGFGKANNIGIKRAYNEGADYFFLLNQDAWVEPDTIQKLMQKQQNHPEFGILSPLHFFDYKTLDRKFKSYLKGKGNEIIQNLHSDVPEVIYPVKFVNAAIWMISRQCIDTVGLFAPIFEHYGEDMDYAHRCGFHRLKIGIYPRAIAYHEREQSHPNENSIELRKLLYRDKSYWLCILLNVKHSFTRQLLFLFFNSIKLIFKSIFQLKFKTIVVILNRISCITMISELNNQRKQMKMTGAFLTN